MSTHVKTADFVIPIGPYPGGQDKEAVMRDIDRYLQPGDVVLIKGSRGAAMEEFLPVLEAAAERMKVTVS